MFNELVELVKKERGFVYSLTLGISYIVLANIISVTLDYPIINIYLIFIIGILCDILAAVRRWGK